MPKIFTVFLMLALAGASGQPAAAADPVITPPMVTIPAGAFDMGSTADPVDPGYPTSTPVHRVHIKPFKLAKYETTVKQFRQFVDATGYQAGGDCWKLAANEWGMEYGKLSWDSPSIARSEYQPVLCVSWNDAHAYLAWLSQQTGKRYRLPSEAEWEYAARAGATTRYPFGDDPAMLCRHANVFDTSGAAAIARITGKPGKPVACDDGAALTTVAGMYRPNAFGLYDMLGNAGEFVEDCQHLNYDHAPADGSAWTNDCAAFHGGKMVIHRGGNYDSGPIGARPTMRGHAGLDNRSSVGEGFRIAEDAGPDADGAGGAGLPATPAAFEAGLAREQAAERARQAGPASSR